MSPTPPKPSSTLFPYTTLFRSQPFGAHANIGVEQALGLERVVGETSTGALQKTGEHLPVRPHGVDPARDRKSTRLNSSHVEISYAVFCLKKKTHGGSPVHQTPG